MTTNNKPYRLTLRAVMRDAQKRVLMMQRAAKSPQQPGLWELPGGKMDSGETIDKALIREVKEETGFDVLLGNVLGHSQWEKNDTRIAYLIFDTEIISGQLKISPEHDACVWMTAAEIKKTNVAPQLREFVNTLTT